MNQPRLQLKEPQACDDACCLTPARTSDDGTRLTLDNLVPYLMTRGFISPQDVVDAPHDTFTLLNYSSRNRAFKVLVPGRAGLMVKQAMDPDAAEYRDTLEQEARLLAAIAAEPTLRALRPLTPALKFYDPEPSIVVTELVHPATTLTKLHMNLGAFGFPKASGAAAGRLLATFHEAGGAALRKGRLDFLPRRPPSVFHVLAKLDSQRRAEPKGAAAKLADRVRKEASYWSRAPAAEQTFHAAQGVVHRDPRWDNFLVTHGAGAQGGVNMRLIDLELTVRGDPAWDVAFCLAEYLRFWTFFASNDPATRTLADVRAKERFTWRSWHGATRSFWRAYTYGRGMDVRARRALLSRVTDYMPFNALLLANESLPAVGGRPWTVDAPFDLSLEAAANPSRFMRDAFGLEQGAA